MAGTSQKTTTVGVRVPNEVLAVWQAEAETMGLPTSSYVLHRAQRSGGDVPITTIFGDGERRVVGTGHEGGIVTVANAGAIILELQDRISQLEAQLLESRWEQQGQAVVPRPKTAQPIDPKTRHQSGPVLASAVPVVDGNTGWSGLKGSDKKGKRP